MFCSLSKNLNMSEILATFAKNRYRETLVEKTGNKLILEQNPRTAVTNYKIENISRFHS